MANGNVDPLGAPPANVNADPNEATDSVAQQEAWAMKQFNTNGGAYAYVQSSYADVAWMLDIPELKAILVSAAVNGWGQGQIDGALYQTQWWQQYGAQAGVDDRPPENRPGLLQQPD